VKACIVGHTGRGDYGHGLDLAFRGIPGVELAGIADPDEKGRAEAVRRAGAARGYADWREMLRGEKPELVVAASRWVEGRAEVAVAALEQGAHVFVEKPMAVSLEEADRLLAAAERAKVQLAVAHVLRLSPAVLELKRRVDDGLIGDLLEIRARGKEDRRAGGEDLLVHGTHCFYLMRLFAGEPISCSARVTEKGRDATTADRRAGTEPVGPVAGDSVVAAFDFPGGVRGHFASQRNPEARYQFGLYGTKGAALILPAAEPQVLHLPDSRWSGDGWRPLDAPASGGTEAGNRRMIEAWIEAARTGRPSPTSGAEGRAGLEMMMAVYASHLSGRRVEFPLADRRHPLGER